MVCFSLYVFYSGTHGHGYLTWVVADNSARVVFVMTSTGIERVEWGVNGGRWCGSVMELFVGLVLSDPLPQSDPIVVSNFPITIKFGI